MGVAFLIVIFALASLASVTPIFARQVFPGALSHSTIFTSNSIHYFISDCATICYSTAIYGGCLPTDNTCLCNSQEFLLSFGTCNQRYCTEMDLRNANLTLQEMCAAVVRFSF